MFSEPTSAHPARISPYEEKGLPRGVGGLVPRTQEGRAKGAEVRKGVYNERKCKRSSSKATGGVEGRRTCPLRDDLLCLKRKENDFLQT